jgi:hypothetical protein
MIGWANRHPFPANLLITLLIVVPGYLRIEGIIDQACEDRRDQAILLRGLVELSDDGNGALNLTGFPSFNDLDPAMQRYLRDLENASRQAPNPSRFVENALKLVQVPEC